MDKNEYVENLAEFFDRSAKTVAEDWKKLEETDIVMSLKRRGKDADRAVWQMLKAQYSLDFVGQTENYQLFILSRSNEYTTKNGESMITVVALGGIPASKKFGLIRLLCPRESGVRLAQQLEPGKLYKGNFSPATLQGAVMTAWYAESSRVEEIPGELPEVFADPVKMLSQMFPKVPIKGLAEYVKDGYDAPLVLVEGQVVTSTVRPRRDKKGQMGFLRIVDDSITASKKDLVEYGGGLSVLLNPEEIKFGQRSTVVVLGRPIEYQPQGEESRSIITFNAEAVIPIIEFPVDVDLREKVPPEDVPGGTDEVEFVDDDSDSSWPGGS
jgi:hypothetical protein